MAASHNDFTGDVRGTVFQGRDFRFGETPQPALTGIPAAPADFVGRAEELAAVLAEERLVVIHGVGGAGKTALALRAAQGGAGLFLDLQGYRDPLAPETALAILLDHLGAPPPAEPAGAAARYRSALAELVDPLVIVLDNAGSAEQVRPLLPGGPHKVIVTSRHTLGGLGPALRIPLGPLSSAEATGFLAHSRPGDPGLAELAEQCGRLPLALRITASILGEDPDRPVRTMTAALAEARLDELAYDGDLDVRATFQLSYQRLSAAEARMFRLLAAHPGPQVSTEAAAALAEVSVAEARRLLDGLRRASMIGSGEPWGRYRLHDLMRDLAEELFACEPEPARGRLLRFYARVATYALAPAEPAQSEEHAATLRWLEVERGALHALLDSATAADDDLEVLTVGWLLYEDLMRRWNFPRLVCLISVLRPRWLRCFTGQPDRLGQVLADVRLLESSVISGLDPALLRSEVERMRGDPAANPVTRLAQEAALAYLRGDLQIAVWLSREAVECWADMADPGMTRMGLIQLGSLLFISGDQADAAECVRRALALSEEHELGPIRYLDELQRVVRMAESRLRADNARHG